MQPKVIVVEAVPAKEDGCAPVAECVVIEQQNDSTEGLARMYADLEPLAMRVRASACSLFFISLLFCGTLEGMLGVIAGASVLCCAAPGSLGTAYAARCTKVCATMCAIFSLVHLMCIASFSVAILPEIPTQMAALCAAKEEALGTTAYVTGGSALLATGEGGADADDAAFEGFFAVDGFSATLFADKKDLMVSSKVIDGSDAPKAAFVATVVASGSRKLQELVYGADDLAPVSEHCAAVARHVADVAPLFMLSAGLLEMCIFLSAVRCAKWSALLVNTARAYGANAI